MEEENKKIWTIGHSTRPLEEFLSMLHSFNIEMVADIRSFPGSRKFPQYNKEALSVSLPQNNIQYVHLKSLGGRRKVKPDSKNTAWRNAAFRGYADYMETNSFKEGITELEKIALKQRTAYMCSEAVWWRCHRSMVSDYLKLNGWNVMHIMGIRKEEIHPYTSPARIVNGKLSYQSE
ncbi:MAG TPA: Fe-S cluster assembly protein HesB [Sphingobacteriaceae bacterium]|nr:Fe-S cluster assembly protein HesB [Sphingobacteriaceae bacterium]